MAHWKKVVETKLAKKEEEELVEEMVAERDELRALLHGGGRGVSRSGGGGLLHATSAREDEPLEQFLRQQREVEEAAAELGTQFALLVQKYKY
jgi:hypothetical protein